MFEVKLYLKHSKRVVGIFEIDKSSLDRIIELIKTEQFVQIGPIFFSVSEFSHLEIKEST